MADDFLAKIKAKLEASGYVVLKAASYRRAQERQHLAQALLASQERENEHTRAWAHRAFDEQRILSDRCTYLYGLAASLGATEGQLRGAALTQRQETQECRSTNDG